VAGFAGLSNTAHGGLDGSEFAGFGGDRELGKLLLHLVGVVVELDLLFPNFGFGVGSPLSEPSTNPAHGNLPMYSATAALSAATLGSNGTLPCAMAATRPKFCCITNKALLRYLIACSGLANWAWAAGANTIELVISMKAVIFFMVFFKEGFQGSVAV